MRAKSEVGAITVAMIGVLVLGLTLMVGAARVGTALVARARAQTAADAAALAAAETLAFGGDVARASADAAAAAAANGARLERCVCAGPTTTATVVIDVPVLGRVARVTARAEVRGLVLPDP